MANASAKTASLETVAEKVALLELVVVERMIAACMVETMMQYEWQVAWLGGVPFVGMDDRCIHKMERHEEQGRLVDMDVVAFVQGVLFEHQH